MASENEGFALGFFKDIEEERRLQAEEFQIRYAERRRQKQNHRDMIESTAAKVCEAANKAMQKAEETPPEELVQIAAALNSAALAMQTAEQYAEYTPYHTGGFCAV